MNGEIKSNTILTGLISNLISRCRHSIFEGNTASILTYSTASVAVANKGRMPYQIHIMSL